MNALARALHPPALELRVESAKRETANVATFRLAPAASGERLPPFRAGQYLAARFEIGGLGVSRPFSISSTPDEALRGNYYDLTVKLEPAGFCTPHLFDEWKPGKLVRCSGPSGNFYYEKLRDGENVVCLAGGAGITPFRSLVADALEHEDANLTLIHGFARPEDRLFAEDFERLAAAHPGRLRLVPVCAEPDAAWSGERGFLSSELIRASVPGWARATYFICGPQALRSYLELQMAGWGLRPRQVRRESFAPSPGPGRAAGRRVSIELRSGALRATIPADTSETVLVALERAGLDPPSLCRSGDCGWCRSRLESGELVCPEDGSRLRAADRRFGYFHPCRSFPLSDIVMEIPRNTLSDQEGA